MKKIYWVFLATAYLLAGCQAKSVHTEHDHEHHHEEETEHAHEEHNHEHENIIMNMKKPEKVMQPARSYSRRQMPKLSVCRRKK